MLRARTTLRLRKTSNEQRPVSDSQARLIFLVDSDSQALAGSIVGNGERVRVQKKTEVTGQSRRKTAEAKDDQQLAEKE